MTTNGEIVPVGEWGNTPNERALDIACAALMDIRDGHMRSTAVRLHAQRALAAVDDALSTSGGTGAS